MLVLLINTEAGISQLDWLMVVNEAIGVGNTEMETTAESLQPYIFSPIY